MAVNSHSGHFPSSFLPCRLLGPRLFERNFPGRCQFSTAQSRGLRLTNREERVPEIACETAVLNLRRRNGIVLDEFKSRTGFGLFEIFGGVVERFVENGMLIYDKPAGRVFVSRKALPVADTVICEFANY